MLVIIPARGGSKGVPRKNLKNLNGKPLVLHTVDVARQIFEDKDILVSTDDVEIKQLVESSGLSIPFLRPASLATDEVGMEDVLMHAVDYMRSKGRDYDTIVLLQPTSPLRTTKHVLDAIELYKEDEDVEMVVSVKQTKANPYFVLKEENSKGYLENSKKGDFVRRQDCPKVWELNGAVYIIKIESLKGSSLLNMKKIKKYEMDEISSHDIDTELDWKVVETLLRNQKDF